MARKSTSKHVASHKPEFPGKTGPLATNRPGRGYVRDAAPKLVLCDVCQCYMPPGCPKCPGAPVTDN